MIRTHRQRGAFVFLVLFAVAISAVCVAMWWAVRRQRINRALILAVKAEDTNKVVSLLEDGADANSRDEVQRAQPPWRLLMDLLRGRKPHPSSAPTPLLLALSQSIESMTDGRVGHPTHPLKMTAALLRYGADVNVRDEYGVIPLMLALKPAPTYSDEAEYVHEHVAIAHLLLDRGANVKAQGVYGETPLDDAVLMGDASLVDRILKLGAPMVAPNENGDGPCGLAISDDRADIVQLFLDRGLRIDSPDAEGASLLHLAAYEGAGKVVNLLLDRGVAVNALDHHKRTPLMSTACYHHWDRESQLCATAAVLVRHGAILDATDEDGNTALIHAIVTFHEDLAVLLIRSGAHVNQRNRYYPHIHGLSPDLDGDKHTRFTPLMYAAYSLEEKVVRALLDHDADVNLRNGQGQTALTLAQRGAQYSDEGRTRCRHIVAMLKTAGATW